MDNNIINTYAKLIKTRLLDFFKIVLKTKYQKNVVEPFVDRYIEVRYFDETNYSKEKNFITRLNKDLVDVYDDNVNNNNEDILRTIVALFGYLIYLDEFGDPTRNIGVIKLLSLDRKIKIDLSDTLFDEIKEWYTNFQDIKNKFHQTVSTKEFQIVKKSVYRKSYEVTLEHNIKISNLYSDYAINRAFNTGTTVEDKLFIIYILTCYEILNEAIKFDHSNKYIVDLANTLYAKEKKIVRLFNILNSSLAKKEIRIKINYTDYLENKKFINSKIKEGYNFAIVLDREDIDFNELILFSYIYVFENSEIFDIINKNKENIDAKIIKM